jgi:uncharacterized protein
VRLVVFGGTEPVGARVVDEALLRGHEVTMVTREPEAVVPRPSLFPVAGDARDSASLVGLLRGHDAAVSGFRADWENPNLYDDSLRAVRSILLAARQAGLPRLLWIGGPGSLEVAPGVQLVDTPGFPKNLRGGGLAARETLRLLQQERDLDWVLLTHAIRLEEGPRTGIYRTGGDSPVYGANRNSHISVRDLAVAVLDELERPQHHRRRFTVGY